LRQQSNIKVISAAGTWPSTSNYSDVGVGWGLMFTAIILIVASISIIIVIFILQRKRLITYKDRGRLILHGSPDGPMNQRLKKLDYGAKVLTGISFFFFVAWIEHTMWPFPTAERFMDIGQWGHLTDTLLVLAFAAYKYVFGFVDWACRKLRVELRL
jgi:hypothetical protein